MRKGDEDKSPERDGFKGKSKNKCQVDPFDAEFDPSTYSDPNYNAKTDKKPLFNPGDGGR
ncbi:uncharacterized protein LOC62_05G007203 [Vanrija pseudolonga]|uniref:Uncharacterized protein n=1 Tax=Vanrija pseudolonga TaxID=143232 RepID=A0AAF1BSM2_9TREE|nr:hypothetical protein LOC62_05G007203 [Vanrija pseudolonga]